MYKAKQVFISYDQNDKHFASRLSKDLETFGINVWIAPDSILPGESWVDAINRGLEESSHMVVVLTPSAVESQWVKMETNAGIDLERKGKIKLIPLDVISCRMPPLWSSYQKISFSSSYEAGFNLLATMLDVEKARTAYEQLSPMTESVHKGNLRILERDYPRVADKLKAYELAKKGSDKLEMLVKKLAAIQAFAEVNGQVYQDFNTGKSKEIILVIDPKDYGLPETSSETLKEIQGAMGEEVEFTSQLTKGLKKLRGDND